MININEIAKARNNGTVFSNDYVHGFAIYNREEGTETRIDDIRNNGLFLSDALLEILIDKKDKNLIDENGYIKIQLSEFIDISQGSDAFFVQYVNKEISKPLHELKSLIEKGSEIDGVTSISGLIDNIKRLIREGGINTASIHTEIITRNLIRDANNIAKLPDYSQDEINVKFISIHNSILNGPSLIQGITFERIGQQLRSPATYNKTGTSPYDILFDNV